MDIILVKKKRKHQALMLIQLCSTKLKTALWILFFHHDLLLIKFHF